MKHRLASLGPTGRLWPSFPILRFFSSFFSGGINAVPPSPSSFHLCIRCGLFGGEAVSETGMGGPGGGGRGGGVYRFMCVTVQGPSGKKWRRRKGNLGNDRLMEDEMMRRRWC